MARILLLGAGFSHNWQGWLASEVMGKLLGRLASDEDLHLLLRRADNFEDALSKVQEEFRNSPTEANKRRLERMQAAVMDTFHAMNQSFADRPGMEFSNDARFSIIKFLSKFDAIFTLNQDLLLELHYNIELAEPRRWNGHYWPGMDVPAGWRNASGPFLKDRLNLVWRPVAEQKLEPNLQPIYKLHGSTNWKAGGADMLVLGGNKAGTISETRLLRWYADEFRRYLRMPDTRMMVIGYSFGDWHIDQLLKEEWDKSGFRMFIVDPSGRKVLNKKTDRGFKILSPLESVPIVGESTRLIRNTFSGDALEHGELLRFFDANI